MEPNQASEIQPILDFIGNMAVSNAETVIFGIVIVAIIVAIWRALARAKS